jgi:hypothetical protein
MPSAPGTTSTTLTTSSHSSRMRAARPAALGRAPQGTQYSIRTWWRSTIASIQPRGVRPPSQHQGEAHAAGAPATPIPRTRRPTDSPGRPQRRSRRDPPRSRSPLVETRRGEGPCAVGRFGLLEQGRCAGLNGSLANPLAWSDQAGTGWYVLPDPGVSQFAGTTTHRVAVRGSGRNSRPHSAQRMTGMRRISSAAEGERVQRVPSVQMTRVGRNRQSRCAPARPGGLASRRRKRRHAPRSVARQTH